MNSIEKYLAHHAQAGTQDHAANIADSYAQALVVPAYDEDPARLKTLAGLCQRHDTLFILVVNTPTHGPSEAQHRTLKLLEQCNFPHTLVIDRVTTPIPSPQGVGLARKIGNDVALALFAQQKLRSPWIYQTDADALPPEHYFDQNLPGSGTVIFDHQHQADDPAINIAALNSAAALYDQHMAYYVAGLAYAKSPYAYPALGSTLAIHAQSYASVHGFPKRNAGEDFHILNKLKKIGPITRNHTVTVVVAARTSTRVPFGTGPALTKIISGFANHDTQTTIQSYHPTVFVRLAAVIAELNQFAAQPASAKFSATNLALLEALGWQRVRGKLQTRYQNHSQRSHAVHTWFDALRTLRLIHLLQRQHPDQPLAGSLANLPVGFKFTH